MTICQKYCVETIFIFIYLGTDFCLRAVHKIKSFKTTLNHIFSLHTTFCKPLIFLIRAIP